MILRQVDQLVAIQVHHGTFKSFQHFGIWKAHEKSFTKNFHQQQIDLRKNHGNSEGDMSRGDPRPWPHLVKSMVTVTSSYGERPKNGPLNDWVFTWKMRKCYPLVNWCSTGISPCSLSQTHLQSGSIFQLLGFQKCQMFFPKMQDVFPPNYFLFVDEHPSLVKYPFWNNHGFFIGLNLG